MGVYRLWPSVAFVFSRLLRARGTNHSLEAAKRCNTSSRSCLTYRLNDRQFVRRFITDNTEVSRCHLTPEIKLHLITPSCRLWSCQTPDDLPVPDPYWAFYWPGGQALTRYILDNPHLVRNKSVLDVGSGCGASAIACALKGCTKVVANDIDPACVMAIEINASVNNVEVTICTDNLLRERLSPGYDVLLLGDMFYDVAFSNKLSHWLSAMADTLILIGDPGRWAFSNIPITEHFKELERYEMPEELTKENNGYTSSIVYQYDPNITK